MYDILITAESFPLNICTSRIGNKDDGESFMGFEADPSMSSVPSTLKYAGRHAVWAASGLELQNWTWAPSLTLRLVPFARSTGLSIIQSAEASKVIMPSACPSVSTLPPSVPAASPSKILGSSRPRWTTRLNFDVKV